MGMLEKPTAVVFRNSQRNISDPLHSEIITFNGRRYFGYTPIRIRLTWSGCPLVLEVDPPFSGRNTSVTLVSDKPCVRSCL
jgi:hypothetical protein